MMTGAIGDHPKWNKEQFTAFLLLYGAYADSEYKDEEREYILSRVEKPTLEDVQEEYDVLSDFERLNVIGIYQQEHYDTEEKKALLFRHMQELFDSDGKYCDLEQALMRKLIGLL